MNVTLTAFPRSKIEFEVGIGTGGLEDMLERRQCEWRASQVGVQDHARGIDYRLQRIAEPFAKLTHDSFCDAGQCEVNCSGVEATRRNLVAQAGEDGSSRVDNRNLSFLREPGSELGP